MFFCFLFHVLFVDLFSYCTIITFHETAFDNQSIFVGSNYAVVAVESKQPATLGVGGAPEVSSVAEYSAVDTSVEMPEAHCVYSVPSSQPSAPPIVSTFTLFGRTDPSRSRW